MPHGGCTPAAVSRVAPAGKMKGANDRAESRPRRPEAEAVMTLKIRVYSDYV